MHKAMAFSFATSGRQGLGVQSFSLSSRRRKAALQDSVLFVADVGVSMLSNILIVVANGRRNHLKMSGQLMTGVCQAGSFHRALAAVQRLLVLADLMVHGLSF